MYIDKDVEIMLENHLKNISKKKEARRKIKDLEDIKAYNRKQYKMNEADAIESMQLGSTLSGNISSKTNKVSSAVEKTALTYKSNQEYTNNIDFIKIEGDIQHYKEIEKNVSAQIEQVEDLLNALNNVEKFVIEQFYMYCDKRWDYVKDAFIDEYQDTKSAEQLRRYKKTAMRKMLEVINLE